MRLIDADAFKAEGRELYRDAEWDLRAVHYSQMDVECNIDMMPTIEAIPVEWVQKRMFECVSYSIVWIVLRDLLREWERRNDEANRR